MFILKSSVSFVIACRSRTSWARFGQPGSYHTVCWLGKWTVNWETAGIKEHTLKAKILYAASHELTQRHLRHITTFHDILEEVLNDFIDAQFSTLIWTLNFLVKYGRNEYDVKVRVLNCRMYKPCFLVPDVNIRYMNHPPFLFHYWNLLKSSSWILRLPYSFLLVEVGRLVRESWVLLPDRALDDLYVVFQHWSYHQSYQE